MPRQAGLPNQKIMDPLMQEWDHANDLGTRGACDGRSDIFADYKNPFGDHSEAKRICDTCPLSALCDQLARTVKPAWGIWNGRVWVDGRTRGIRTIYTEQEGPDDTEGPGGDDLAEVIQLERDIELDLVG
jgi:hypothetical protein